MQPRLLVPAFGALLIVIGLLIASSNVVRELRQPEEPYRYSHEFDDRDECADIELTNGPSRRAPSILSVALSLLRDDASPTHLLIHGGHEHPQRTC